MTTTVIVGLGIFLGFVLLYLVIVMFVEIGKALSSNKREPSPFSQKLNGAEIVFIILFLAVFVFLAVSLPKEYSWIVTGLGGGFGIMIAQGHQHKQQKKISGVSNPPRRKAYSKEYEAKYRRLLGMVGGNKQVCDSLISAYGVDRAIEDLIRDRQ